MKNEQHIKFIGFDNPELLKAVPYVWDEMTCFIKECHRATTGDIVAYCRGFASTIRFNAFRHTDTTLLFKEFQDDRTSDILVLTNQIQSIEFEGRSENARGKITSEYLLTLYNGVEIGIHL